jgi:hypothetical protein
VVVAGLPVGVGDAAGVTVIAVGLTVVDGSTEVEGKVELVGGKLEVVRGRVVLGLVVWVVGAVVQDANKIKPIEIIEITAFSLTDRIFSTSVPSEGS